MQNTMTGTGGMDAPMAEKDRKAEREWRYAEKALEWSGWGSPVGLGIMAISGGIFLVAVGAFLWLLHLAELI